jgi:hypothetical protein
MPSVGTLKRISRIRRRATPAVRQAYENGEISAKRADLLLYLAAGEQATQLEACLRQARAKECANRLVADTIRTYLNSLNGRRVDLHELGQRIREALAFAKTN